MNGLIDKYCFSLKSVASRLVFIAHCCRSAETPRGGGITARNQQEPVRPPRASLWDYLPATHGIATAIFKRGIV